MWSPRSPHVSPPALCVLIAAGLLTGSEAHAATVRVMARPALRVETHVQGALVELTGIARDPVGRPLADLPLTLSWDGPRPALPPSTTATNDEGRFSVRRILADGDWQIDVRFAGNAYLAPAAAAATVHAERVPLEILCAAPRFVTLEAGEAPVVCEASLGGAPWTATPIALDTPCAEDTSADGLLADPPAGATRWQVRSDTAGECSVEASIPASDVHAGGSAVFVVRFVQGAELLWDAQPAPLPRIVGPRYRVNGSLRDAAGPIDGAPIELAVGSVRVSARTDSGGTFTAVLDASPLDVGVHRASATFVADLPAGEILATASPLDLTRARGLSELAVLAGGLLLLAVGILLAWLAGQGRGRWRRGARRERGQMAPLVAPLPAPDAQHALVVVVDSASGERVWGAQIAVHATDGETSWRASPAGEVRLHPLTTPARLVVSAPAYLTWQRADLTLGAACRVVVHLRPVRVHVRDLVHALLDQLDLREAELRWGRSSVTAIRTALRRGLRALRRERAPERVASRELERLLELANGSPPDAVAAAEALVLLLDRVWWAQVPAEEDAALADALAARVHPAASRSA